MTGCLSKSRYVQALACGQQNKLAADTCYVSFWLWSTQVELDWHAVPHAQKLTGEDGIWDPLSYPSLDYSADILGHSWQVSDTLGLAARY